LRTADSQFAKNAEKYRDAPLFAEGEDLGLMVNSIRLSGTETVLDIGAGAGHTALAFAPHVQFCYGVDVTEEMVQVANQFAADKGVRNAQFQVGDVAELPYDDASFDIVTCRFAAHHFTDVEQAIAEIARVLKPGGTFQLVDHYAPESQALDAFVNALDRMRDPSHVRESTLSQWQAFFARHGLAYDEVSRWDLPLDFENWVERAGVTQEMRQKLVSFLQSAAPDCKETFRVMFTEDGVPQSFCLKVALVHGRKRSV
jgi:SAM-dependent methyltransferase